MTKIELQSILAAIIMAGGGSECTPKWAADQAAALWYCVMRNVEGRGT